jgi:hypothetical protein
MCFMKHSPDNEVGAACERRDGMSPANSTGDIFATRCRSRGDQPRMG